MTANERAELIRLLHQRHQDTGDTLARKAAWALEEISKAAGGELFEAEDEYAPTHVTGPNGFRFLCYNGKEMARQLNALFAAQSHD